MSAASHSSHEQFLRLFLSGDDRAAREVDRWARELIRYRGFGFTAEELEDTVQETLTDVWSAITREGFELKHGLKALVRTVASARCIDRMRRRRPTADVSESLEDSGPSPYEDLLKREAGSRLRWALQQLGESCREIIRLRFFEGRSYQEIAGALERAESTLRVRMFNCMKSLRGVMTRFEG